MGTMDGITQCAAAMETAQRRLEVAADNLANAETDGFHGHVLAASGRGTTVERLRSGHGPLRPTGRALDVAIAGNGTLRVAPLNADTVDVARAVAVRSGSFHRSPAGLLLDERGRALLGTAGAIRVPDGVDVRPDGTFAKDGTAVARVELPAGASLRSGFLEGSDVNPIGEMVAILDAQRSFETAEKTLVSVDAARQKSANDVGHVS